MKVLKRFFLFLTLLLIFLLLQSTVLRTFLPAPFVPNLFVIFVVYLGFYRVTMQGVFLAFLLGMLLDFSSGYVLGPWAGSFVVIFSILAVLADRIFVESQLTAIIMVFFSTIVAEFLYFSLSIDPGVTYVQLARTALSTAIITALLAPPVLYVIKRFFGMRRIRATTF